MDLGSSAFSDVAQWFAPSMRSGCLFPLACQGFIRPAVPPYYLAMAQKAENSQLVCGILSTLNPSLRESLPVFVQTFTRKMHSKVRAHERGTDCEPLARVIEGVGASVPDGCGGNGVGVHVARQSHCPLGLTVVQVICGAVAHSLILPGREIRNLARVVEISAHNSCGYDGHLFAVQPRPEAEGQAPAAVDRAEAVPSASLRCAITRPMAVRVAGVPAMGFSIAKS